MMWCEFLQMQYFAVYFSFHIHYVMEYLTELFFVHSDFPFLY